MNASLPASPSLENTGSILAIDYGRRRIGLAISDLLGLTSQPLQTLERTNRRNDLRRLREIVRRHEVRRVLIGHPLHLDGSAGEMAAEVARFAARIERELRLPVELVDERLSSWEAEQILAGGEEVSSKQGAIGSRRPGRQRAEEVDQVAAAVILRDYLERTRQRSAPLTTPRAEARQRSSSPHRQPAKV